MLRGGGGGGGGGGGISLDTQRSTLDRVNLEISMEMDDMAVRRRRFIRDETQVLDYLKPQDAALAARKPRANRRAAGRMTEREEDEALLRRTEEEEAGATVTQKMERMLPLTAQPSLLEGGVLRDYQLEGLNWMASLYVNGASGMHFSQVLYKVASHNR
jgi:SNF2 family DNA or RNA helicase